MQIQKYFKSKVGNRSSLITNTACGLLLVCSAPAHANTPILLNNAELDNVSAGGVSIKINAMAIGSNSTANVTLSSTATTNGTFSLETASALGQASVCCHSGKTTISLSGDSLGIKSGGGGVTSTIKILKYGSYSFAYGVQISVSKN